MGRGEPGPVRNGRASRPSRVEPATTAQQRPMGTPRIMVVLLAAAGGVVAAVVALTLQSWWVLGGVLVVHFVATVTVVAYALRRASENHDICCLELAQSLGGDAVATAPRTRPSLSVARAPPCDVGCAVNDPGRAAGGRGGRGRHERPHRCAGAVRKRQDGGGPPRKRLPQLGISSPVQLPEVLAEPAY